MDVVRQKIQEAGFLILKLTSANVLMSLITAVGWSMNYSRDKAYRTYGLPRRLPVYLNWLNTTLFWWMKCEAWFLSKSFGNSPFGNSILCLAQKPNI